MPTLHIDYRRHIASLDGLRGLAICLVFLHHYYPRQRGNPLSILASGGWVGVDIFFVLSGFLITGILYDTLGRPNSLRNFFARRSLRIFPAYLVMVALVVVLARPLRVPLGWRDIPFFAYGSNLTRIFQVDPTFGPYLRFWHLWSLAVEEQFYLLWAPLVFLLATRRRILAACWAGIGVAICLRGYLVFHVPGWALNENLPSRMDLLLCGALLALGLRKEHGRPWLQSGGLQNLWLRPGRLRLLFVFGAGILAASAVAGRSLSGEQPFIVAAGYLGNDLWCTALLGLALLPGTVVNRWGASRPLRFLGRYSYGLYLWHEIPGPVFARWITEAQQRSGGLGGTLATAGCFALSLAVAMASYHAIELPFLRLKRYFPYEAPVSE